MTEVPVSNKNQPEKKIKVGNIQVAIWRNKSKTNNVFYSVTFEKYYKEGDEWKSTKSLNKNDVPKAILALEEAYKYLMVRKSDQEIIEDALEDEHDDQ